MCTSGMINSRAFSGRVRPPGPVDEDVPHPDPHPEKGGRSAPILLLIYGLQMITDDSSGGRDG